jgi:hypothetical protein
MSVSGNHNRARSGGRVAVVLPGGGARGAYEIGAVSVLLPALAARGEQVDIWCGTSVGAINATAMAALAIFRLPARWTQLTSCGVRCARPTFSRRLSASEDYERSHGCSDTACASPACASPACLTPTSPRKARGHYADGGTRLNSPIKPALHLGADRVILIGLEPFAEQSARLHTVQRRTVADVAANVLDGLLVDQVRNDLRRLVGINSFFVEDPQRGPRGAARAYRITQGREPYRPISYALVSPRRRGEIGRLAERVFQHRYGGWRAWRGLDFSLLASALGGASRSRGELLSFLLFDEEFVSGLLELGARDAKRWLRRHPRFWCRDAAHDLAPSGFQPPAITEEDALAEFRAHRQR